MSAYVVPESTINELVTFFRTNQVAPRPPEWYDLVEGDPTAAQMLAQSMLDLNVRAVNERYREDEEPERMTYRPTVPPNVRQAYRLLGTYLYQCSEGSVPDTDLYNALSGIHDRLAHEIAHEVIYR
jgi:hypothetical protein